MTSVNTGRVKQRHECHTSTDKSQEGWKPRQMDGIRWCFVLARSRGQRN